MNPMSKAERMHLFLFMFLLIANGFDKTHQKLSESMHTQHMIMIKYLSTLYYIACMLDN